MQTSRHPFLTIAPLKGNDEETDSPPEIKVDRETEDGVLQEKDE